MSLLSVSGFLPSGHYAGGKILFLSLLIIFVLAKASWCLSLLSKALRWREQSEHNYARNVVSTLVVLLPTCFLAHLHIGFWFQGISGWTYETYEGNLYQESPPADLQKNFPKWVETALLKQNAHFLQRKGFITGPLHFVHFKNGSVHPANLDLFPFIFPQYLLRSSDKNLFGDVLTHTLKNKQKGRDFLLPEQISYPLHTPHYYLSYRDTPPAEDTLGYSSWNVTVFHDGNGGLSVVGATNLKWIEWANES